MSKTILAFGEILWDILPTGAMLGGAPFNFAYRVNMLGDQGLMVSRLGQDALGRQARQQIAALGMEMQTIQEDPNHPTGTVRIFFDANRNPDITILPEVAYDYIEITEPLLALAATVDCLCFGTVAQRAPHSRQTLQRLLDAAGNSLKVLDINLRKDCYTPETVAQSLQRADMLKLNEEEARLLAQWYGLGDALPDVVASILARWPLSCCVVTLGERGAFAASTDGQQVYDPGYKVALVDPLGAGDAFTAGFIYERLRGCSLEACCRSGNILGAMVAGQEGATSALTAAEVQQFAESAVERLSDPAWSAFRTP
jgi:fructokinase